MYIYTYMNNMDIYTIYIIYMIICNARWRSVSLQHQLDGKCCTASTRWRTPSAASPSNSSSAVVS